MTISNMHVDSVPVSGQQRAKEFYLQTLGFALIADTPIGPGQR